MEILSILVALLPFVSLSQEIEPRKLSTEENKIVSETCGISPGCLNHKIYGGKLACPGQFPWVLGIRQTNLSAVPSLSLSQQVLNLMMNASLTGHGKNDGSRAICSGTLISPRHVITAAHCFIQCEKAAYKREFHKVIRVVNNDMPNDLETDILIGNVNLTTSDGNFSYKMKYVTIHDDWIEDCYNGGDIAIITLDRDVPPEIANSICLPINRDMMFDGPMNAAGFGFVPVLDETSDKLRYVNLELYDEFVHRNDNKSTSQRPFGTLVTHEPEDKNVCAGDSGGPLMMDDLKAKRIYLAGVVSYGMECIQQFNNKVNNISVDYPGGKYTDPRHYLDWICENTNVGNCGGNGNNEDSKENDEESKADLILNDLEELLEKYQGSE